MDETEDALTLRITDRTLTCRRPTHGELDVGMLSRILSVIVGYQKRLAVIEADPAPGAIVKVANLVGLVGQAAEEIRARVRRALATCAGPETLAWLDEGDETARAQRTVDVAIALVLALDVPAGRVPK